MRCDEVGWSLALGSDVAAGTGVSLVGETVLEGCGAGAVDVGVGSVERLDGASVGVSFIGEEADAAAAAAAVAETAEGRSAGLGTSSKLEVSSSEESSSSLSAYLFAMLAIEDWLSFMDGGGPALAAEGVGVGSGFDGSSVVFDDGAGLGDGARTGASDGL